MTRPLSSSSRSEREKPTTSGACRQFIYVPFIKFAWASFRLSNPESIRRFALDLGCNLGRCGHAFTLPWAMGRLKTKSTSIDALNTADQYGRAEIEPPRRRFPTALMRKPAPVETLADCDKTAPKLRKNLSELTHLALIGTRPTPGWTHSDAALASGSPPTQDWAPFIDWRSLPSETIT